MDPYRILRGAIRGVQVMMGSTDDHGSYRILEAGEIVPVEVIWVVQIDRGSVGSLGAK